MFFLFLLFFKLNTLFVFPKLLSKMKEFYSLLFKENNNVGDIIEIIKKYKKEVKKNIKL